MSLAIDHKLLDDIWPPVEASKFPKFDHTKIPTLVVRYEQEWQDGKGVIRYHIFYEGTDRKNIGWFKRGGHKNLSEARPWAQREVSKIVQLLTLKMGWPDQGPIYLMPEQ